MSDTKGNMFVLGMRDISSKAGQDFLSTFQRKIHDIQDQATKTDDMIAKQILTNRSCTMSNGALIKLFIIFISTI